MRLVTVIDELFGFASVSAIVRPAAPGYNGAIVPLRIVTGPPVGEVTLHAY